jgi:hypothetical protein
MGANTGIAAAFITYLMLLHALRVQCASLVEREQIDSSGNDFFGDWVLRGLGRWR